MPLNVKRGDIFFADLSPVVGSEQGDFGLSSYSKMTLGIGLVLR